MAVLMLRCLHRRVRGRGQPEQAKAPPEELWDSCPAELSSGLTAAECPREGRIPARQRWCNKEICASTRTAEA